VSVTVTSANPSNGVTVSNIINSGGNITANIAASCTATDASFTLQASDGTSTATATLNITVTANTAPTLTYASPQAVAFNGSLNVAPTTATDNGSITGYAVQSVAPAMTTAPTVDTSGVVSITSAQPAGAHIITRGQALRELVDSPEISQRFFNKAFVVVGYFAYLRREPDALYLDWIAKLNNPPAGQSYEDTYREMIRGFIESQEYRHRFGN
jgi:hypothetical protein